MVWPSSSAALAITVSSGCWTKTPNGTVNLPRNNAETPLSSWLSLEGIKFIGAWLPGLVQPLGEDLEITPLGNPLILKKGQKLEILVTLGKQPVEGAVVTYAGKPRGATGRDGKINIRLKTTGRQGIAATYRIDQTTPEFDKVIHTATLDFHLE